MEQLLELVKERQNELFDTPIDATDYEFLNQINLDFKTFTNDDFRELLIGLYMAHTKTNLSETLDNIEIIYTIATGLMERDSENLLHVISMFEDCIQKHNITDLTYEGFIKIRKVDLLTTSLKAILKSLKMIYKIEQINEFIKWVTTNPFQDILVVSCNLVFAKESYNLMPEQLREQIENTDLTNREQKEVLKQITKKLNKHFAKGIDFYTRDELNILASYKQMKHSELKSQIKKAKRKINGLSQLQKDIENDKLSIFNLQKYDLDEDILNQALIELIKQRNVEYTNNYAELSKVANISLEEYEKLFRKYKKNFNNLTEEAKILIKSIDINELNKILELITKGNLSFLTEEDEVFIKVITLPIDLIKTLDTMLLRKQIKPNFIPKHADKINPNNIQMMAANINKLAKLKVNINSLSEYNDEIFLTLNNALLETFMLYGINLQNDIESFEFLENSSLLNIIDKYIEIGLLEKIQTFPKLITPNGNLSIKRILIMNQLGASILNDDDTLNKSIIEGHNFYLSDDDLDYYAIDNYKLHIDKEILELLDSNQNIKPLENLPEEIDFIEDYKINDQIYMIGENYFSRIKVLRCLKTLIEAGYTNYKEILFQSLIYNYPKYLSLETIEELKILGEDITRKQLI